MPLVKTDLIRGFLEEHAYSLSDRHGTSGLIPFIRSAAVG